MGNTFVVNASLSFQPVEKITTLDQSVNYASVFEIIKKRMEVPTGLLETLAQDIIQDIHSFDNRIKSISVSIEKKNLPIPNMEGSVSVNYTRDFN